MPEGVSLRRRLAWYLVTVLLVVTAASGSAVYLSTRHETDEVFNASLVQTARILDGLISRAALDANGEAWQLALQQQAGNRADRMRLFFAVYDADRHLLLHSDQAPRISRDRLKPGSFEFSGEQRNWYAYALESSRDGLLIVVGQRDKERAEITEHIGGGLLLPLILLLPVALWLLWKLIGVALRPLDDVTAQVRRQDIQRLQPIDVGGVPREIDPLVQALNSMIADLDAAYARERRFVSDASHELRNPLASLLINVDNAIEENRDAAILESLQSMKTSIKRLAHLVAQLLELSHCENPLSGRTLQSVDLCRVCRRTIDSLASRARDAGVEIEFQGGEASCEIDGDEALLSSLVSNLVDNAIKYGGRGSRVRVHCARDAYGWQLTVEDSGAGLDARQRARVLERFYRAGGDGSAGAGLGLSIVKTIADLHGARVELDESALGGLRVAVRFDR